MSEEAKQPLTEHQKIRGFAKYLNARGAILIEVEPFATGQYRFSIQYPKTLGEGFGARALAEYNAQLENK